MASDKEYLDYILEQLSETEGITCRITMASLPNSRNMPYQEHLLF